MEPNTEMHKETNVDYLRPGDAQPKYLLLDPAPRRGGSKLRREYTSPIGGARKEQEPVNVRANLSKARCQGG